MPLTIELPSIEQQYAANLTRWEEIAADPQFHNLHPKCVETNRFGQIIMTPPPTFEHDASSGGITSLLHDHLGPNAFGVIAISTSDGTKVADAAWMSPKRRAGNRGKTLATLAPEIVVEVMSPSNTWPELRYKGALYFEAGAGEFWVCDLSGAMHFFLAADTENEKPQSRLCPGFPTAIGG